MMMQWIHEHISEQEELQHLDGFKTQGDFLKLIVHVEHDHPQLISLLAEKLSGSNPLEIELLREFISQQTDKSLDTDMMLTAACAWALGKTPELTTWQKIEAIAWNSWQIENSLNVAMSAYASIDADYRNAYIELAKRLLDTDLINNSNSEPDRKIDARSDDWAIWQSSEYPLEELWWGLRGSALTNYGEEMKVFSLISEIAPTDLPQMIAHSKNPFLVDAVLLSTGVGATVFNPRFSQWEAFAKAAPPAFTQDGNWTGSVLLPLLLVHAQQNLLASTREIPSQDADETEIATLKARVIELARAVVNRLAQRSDAPATFMRWSTWLMQQLLRTKEVDFTDIRSEGFVANALLEEIGKTIKGQRMLLEPPQDAAPWEEWCYRCVHTSFALDGFMSMPAFEEFASQWLLTPEEWRESKGRTLLKRANLHLPGNDLLGLSANLLAAPLAETNDFASSWQQLWDDAYCLREVLEFGSVDAGTKSYSDRVDASHLLLLLECLGLACFDQVAARLGDSPNLFTKEMTSLHQSLAGAAMEVLHLDDTLNRDKWQRLLQHLAMRRVYWDSSYTTEDRVTLFSGQRIPTIRDYLIYFQVDPGDLVTFLHSCMLNDLDAPTLRNALQTASVDLQACVDTLKRLHGLSERKYRLYTDAITAIEPLMNH